MKAHKFPQRLKELMLYCGYTQQRLAAELNTTQQTISRWLKGENEPSLRMLVILCLLFNTTPNYILGFEEVQDLYAFEIQRNVKPLTNMFKDKPQQ